MLDNQGYREKSEVSAKEREAFATYRDECLALPPVSGNDPTAAKTHRTFYVKHFPQLAATMKEMGLDF